MTKVVLIAHDIRSAHNIGSLMRTAEGLGIEKMYITGYSPYPLVNDDPRLPHIARKVSARIGKTSLGAEDSLAWEYSADIKNVIKSLETMGYSIAALEQSDGSTNLAAYVPPPKLALIVGSETDGLSSEILDECDAIVEIPMAGRKESFNVSVAAAMALYHLATLD
jgi:tRNA G18 (ribose-2'-O)-methylase SpoU